MDAKIEILGVIEAYDFIKNNNLTMYQMVNTTIGNNGRIHCLFVENVPERINGMFVPTTNNSKYKAISFTVDWYSGEVYSSEIFDFGLQKINFHFLQPLRDNFLLLGARATLYKDGHTDKNALIIDKFGNRINELCLGDGIENCLVDSKNRIITSYFDEGVFGNYGWNHPIGASGVIKWSDTGEKLWENTNHDICDCYAMNIDDKDSLWFYYYTDFNLVKTDFYSEIVYKTPISGSDGFLLSKGQTALLFHNGYGEKGFCVTKIKDEVLSKPIDGNIVYSGETINVERFAFRDSKAVFVDKKDQIYFLDWTYA